MVVVVVVVMMMMIFFCRLKAYLGAQDQHLKTFL